MSNLSLTIYVRRERVRFESKERHSDLCDHFYRNSIFVKLDVLTSGSSDLNFGFDRA